MSDNKGESGIDMGDYVEYRVPSLNQSREYFFGIATIMASFFILMGVEKGGGIFAFFLSLIIFEIFFYCQLQKT